MKVAFRQDVLEDLLVKGSIAALLENPQEDDGSGTALLRKILKITVDDKKVMVESYSDRLASRYSIDVGKENGVVVKEQGVIAILAKDLLDWVKTQNKNSTIAFNLHSFDSPQPVRNDDNEKLTIFRIGAIKVVSKDGNKTTSQREFDCMDPEQVKSATYGQKAQKCFEIETHKLLTAFEKGCCAATRSDYQNKFNNIYVQMQDKKLYFFTADFDKCARYKLITVGDVEYKDPLVIPFVLFEHVLKVIGKTGNVSIHYNDNKLFMHQDSFLVRLNIMPKVNLSMKIFSRTFENLASVSRPVLTQMFSSSSLVNKDCVLALFSKGNNSLGLKAISETGRHKPATADTSIDNVHKDLRAILGVSGVLNCLRVMKDDKVNLYFSHEENKPDVIKVTSDTESNFEYTIPCLQNALYDEKHDS